MNRLPARRLPRGRRAQDGGRSGVDDRAVGRSRVRLRAGWTATGAEAGGDALQRRVERQLGAALERLALGLGSGVAPPDQPEVPATANGTAVNGASPQARVKPLRPPTLRQQTLWKAIRQAQLQGLSMRATARVLGISRNTVRRYVLAGGPPGRQGAASSTEQRERTCSLNR